MHNLAGVEHLQVPQQIQSADEDLVICSKAPEQMGNLKLRLICQLQFQSSSNELSNLVLQSVECNNPTNNIIILLFSYCLQHQEQNQ